MTRIDAQVLHNLDYPWDPEGRIWTIKVVDDLHVMVHPLIFTAAIIVRHGVWAGGFADFYTDRWCYHDVYAAVRAAEAWDPAQEDEPTGWHRHPLSGRRRPDGDPSKEEKV
ncbi:hypothetical protein [Kineococcus sp. NPDC059986]|uniref:hypothetical protein n=1 Tax=Kineococcus sp. NPDC059986 TaxID=3155538 RepID=UPI00344DBAD2